MVLSNPLRSLSEAARSQIADEVETRMVIDDSFTRTFSPFSAHDSESSATTVDGSLATMREEIGRALDRLEAAVAKVLEDREGAERTASTWIAVGGGVVLVLILAAALSPFFTDGQAFPSIFSSMSLGGLLLLLYSPVRERLAVANDRSNLVLLVHGFRIRFAAAKTEEELYKLGQELTAALAFRGASAD